MRALTLILSDLYLPADAAAPSIDAPSLDLIGRYGTAQPLAAGGWRAWVAREIGREDLAALAPAVIAAGGTAAGDIASGGEPQDGAWIATPVHLQAGLDSVRMAGRAVLALDPADLARIAADFARAFAGSGLALAPLGGEWLLTGLAAPGAVTVEPARVLGADIAPFLPSGPRATALRSLWAELEMWLHAHPINAARAARRQAPLSALWLWGGGEGAAGAQPHAHAHAPVHLQARPRAQSMPSAAGRDPVLRGLWHASGAELPEPAADFAAQRARTGSADCLMELALFPERAPLAGLAALEECWLAPALRALRRGELASLRVVANDRVVRLRAADRWRFWRRARAFLEATR